MTTKQNDLDELWKDPSDALPFNPNINEELILQAVASLHSDKTLTSSTRNKVKQWIKFNKYINMYEDNDYKTWVYQIYAKLEQLCVE